MPNYGYGRGDVNNSISSASAYPGGRSYGVVPQAANRYRVKNNSAGQVGAINQGGAGRMPSAMPGMTPVAAGDAGIPESSGILGKPSSWWILFAVVFVAFVWLARRYGGSEKERFSNVKLSVYNGIFLTFYIILILNLLKVFAAKIKVPGVSDLILAA